jgi:hypothetical protein
MIAFPRSKYHRSCEAWTSGQVSTVIQTTDHSLWSGVLRRRDGQPHHNTGFKVSFFELRARGC